jgi:DHA1 family bicyclomycin/chloramphenicol resistance-like MFS transporter
MAGSFLSSWFSASGLSPNYPLSLGWALATAAMTLLLLMTLADWMPLTLVILLLVLANLPFGLIMPNAVERAMQPLPQIAGVVGAAMGCTQMAMGATASGLVVVFYDGHSVLSMIALMAVGALLSSASYLLLARSAASSLIPYQRHGA